MTVMNSTRCSALVAVAALFAMMAGAGSASAQGANKAAEFAIKYRQALYTTMYGNFGPLGAMVKGTLPFDANVFKTKAERVAYLSVMAAEAFPAESQSGAWTEAKPEIWTNRAEFDKLMKDWQTKAATLAKVSRSGKLETIKPAFLEVGGACKACHDKFREEEKKK